jgi:uncharacterized protein YndB with AHSA1/START domain
MSKTAKSLPPVRKSVTVHATPKRAFEVFTAGMNTWWPAEYTPFPREAIVIEPKRGGRWFEKGTEGSEGNTGKVIDWQAPDRIVLGWQLNGQWQFDPNLVTELEVRFRTDGNGGTIVDLEHRDLERLGDMADATYAVFNGDEGWSALLIRYATAVKGE